MVAKQTYSKIVRESHTPIAAAAQKSPMSKERMRENSGHIPLAFKAARHKDSEAKNSVKLACRRMKVVGLLSGGKDSCYNLCHCVKQGHEIVALATLAPPSGKGELW